MLLAETTRPQSPGRGLFQAPGLLIVDDDAVTREGLAILLRQEGYTVVTAANGREALARLGDGVRPGLILLDVMMPELDGCEVLKRLRTDSGLATTPVLLVTAPSA